MLELTVALTITVMTSDGQKFQAPKAVKRQARYEKLQRVLETKTKGSANRKKILDKMADVRFKVGNRRKDWVEKTTTYLAEKYETVVLEDLKVGDMTKRVAPKKDEQGNHISNGQAAKSRLNRAILGSSWGVLKTRLADKTTVVLCTRRSGVPSVAIQSLGTVGSKRSSSVLNAVTVRTRILMLRRISRT